MSTYAQTAPADDQRHSNLALSFQELFTAMVRLHFRKQSVPDVNAFRAHMRDAFQAASADAGALGYEPEYIQLAVFAAASCLDDAIRQSMNPLFERWIRQPLAAELFPTSSATFPERAQEALALPDTTQGADVAEVFYTCLLLGYLGPFLVPESPERAVLAQELREKLRRVRGAAPGMSTRWSLPKESLPATASSGRIGRALSIALAGCLLVLVLLFGIFKLQLNSGVSELRSFSTQPAQGN